MYAKKRKINTKNLLFVVIPISIIIIVFISIMIINYKNSFPYKLKKIGYNKTEIRTIVEFSKEQIEKILTLEYNPDIIDFIKEKYYIMDNLEEYLEYQKSNPDMSKADVVAVVNVGANHEWYDEKVVRKTDITKGEDGILMLVNKFNALDKDYNPDDIVKISNWYAYEGNSIREVVYEKLKGFYNAARNAGYYVVINSSYRTYEQQERDYNNFLTKYGKKYADSYAARPGHSEHQTGLAFDINPPGAGMDDYEQHKDAYDWLAEHAHEYGFILRYPKGKEHITGYNYEPWHFRYVGEKVAKEIYEQKITFDEYYAFYLK